MADRSSPGQEFRPLKILLVSMEVAPLAKVGGLADVAAALPVALAALGHDVRVVMPCYPMIEANERFALEMVRRDLPVPAISGADPVPLDRCDVLETRIRNRVPVLLLRHTLFFKSVVSSAAIYSPSVEAYLFFTRAVFALTRAPGSDWTPDVIHCNDWHTGLIPALLSTHYRPQGMLEHTASLFTIHNLAYQGLFGAEILNRIGLKRNLFTARGLEFFGNVSFLKAGLVYADGVNTVSPTYAREIRTREHGSGLEGVLGDLAAAGKLRGILNGIDTEEYDPARDPRIAAAYSADRPAGKARCKAALQRELGLEVDRGAPLLAMVSRLFAQKGLDLLAPILERLLALGFQFVVLGQGESRYEALLQQAAARFPGQMAVRIGYQEDLGQRIYAGADAFLMPSRFEPCGLGQLMALRYGALPVARNTGGLTDTVKDDDGVRPDATGFLFEGYAPETLLECLKRVRCTYENRPRWRQLVREAMRSDFSWTRSAGEYVKLYEELRGRR